MEETINKMINLIDNYRKSFEIISEKTPKFDSINKNNIESFFITAEIIEGILEIDKQLFIKFEYIVDVCLELTKNIKKRNDHHTNLLSRAIRDFELCRTMSYHFRNDARIHLSQVKSMEFKKIRPNLNEKGKKEISFCEDTLESYYKKEKNLEKKFEYCMGKVSRLYKIVSKE